MNESTYLKFDLFCHSYVDVFGAKDKNLKCHGIFDFLSQKREMYDG